MLRHAPDRHHHMVITRYDVLVLTLALIAAAAAGLLNWYAGASVPDAALAAASVFGNEIAVIDQMIHRPKASGRRGQRPARRRSS